ncbi:MAG: hypothetical protein U0694_20315 [Anaerolineae bacterium]
MKVTVCELSNDAAVFAREWQALVAHVKQEQSELVLLPELPFFRWFGTTREQSAKVWNEAEQAHDMWLARIAELVPATVLGTRPVTRGAVYR